MLTMRTARRQWIRNSQTGGAFFLDTSQHARRLQQPSHSSTGSWPGGLGGAAGGSPGTGGDMRGVDNAQHKALAAAGLSEEDIMLFAASVAPADVAASDAAAAACASSASTAALVDSAADLEAKLVAAERSSRALASRSGSRAGSRDYEAALSSADLEMQAHIAAQSLFDIGSSSASGGSREQPVLLQEQEAEWEGDEAGELSKEVLSRFLRDFELSDIKADDLVWGLGPSAAAAAR